MYTIKPFQMTPKTLIYQVYYNNQFCFHHTKEQTVINIIKAFEANNINSMQLWLNAPFSLRKKFIWATTNIAPLFHQ